MFRLFGKKPPKDTSSLAYKKYMAEKLDGKPVKYALEKDGDEERIISRGGSINLRDDELIVNGDSKIIFRIKVADLNAWEFMSLNGVVISGYDLEENKERSITAYYSYYRK
ncbi:MAG: hypothetical protein PHY15_03535 [Eubacteriales bacterium]|nr:hypothetical protein [Eubacteriales bacterium]